MGLIENIKGAMGLQGPAGANGVVGLFVASWANPNMTVAKSNPAIGFTASTRTVTFLVAGWYLVDWGASAAFQAANSTLVLSKANHQIIGPLT